MFTTISTKIEKNTIYLYLWVMQNVLELKKNCCVKHALTIADGPPGDLPQDEAQGPDVHSLVGLETVHLDGVIEHFGGHVALRAHFRVVPHIQLVGVLKMHDRQT